MAEIPYYDGVADVFLDNNDVLGFANESDLQKDLKITIINSTGSDQQLILFPSLTPEALIPIVTDGTIGGISGFTATGDTHSIEFFKQAILANPTRVLKTKISTNNVDMFTRVFDFRQLRLGQKPIDNQIKLERYENVFQQNDKVIVITDDFQLDRFKQLKTIIPAAVGGVATRVAITFEFGFSLDTAIALESKAKFAMRVPAVAQAISNRK